MQPLKFIALSGTTGVTENCYIYEYGNDMIVVDCGVGFPEQDMPGVDLVIPDFSYIKENSHKLRAIIISHGHEDHMGALPFLLSQVSVPVYSTKLVAGFIEDKLADYRIKGKINVFDPEKDVLSLGVFKITPFRVSHSVPDGVGFMIDTPEGKICHTADYKFDWTPVDAKPFDISKLAILSSGGVLAVASDCIGATNPGYTESEREIEERIEKIAIKAKGKILFTTISSNISRIKQALNVAQKLGRKVVFVGRSIDKKAEIARKLGYLDYPEGLVIFPRQAKKHPASKLMFIISGSYGQPGSALYRVALGEHEFISTSRDDVVIFSSDPAPPGSKANVDFLVDKLLEGEVDVHYYDLQEDLHVSGHGARKDIEMLFAITKSKYFLPIGGTKRHMRAYGEIAQASGAKKSDVFELNRGEIVEFKERVARISGRIPAKEVLVDGLGIGDVGSIVLRDRQILSKEGVVIVLIQMDKTEGRIINTPDIISRGFVYENTNSKFLSIAAKELSAKLNQKKFKDARAIKDLTVAHLERYFFDKTGRRPMVMPVLVEI